MIRGCSLRFVYAVKVYAAISLGNHLFCGNDPLAIAMPFAMQ